VSASDSSNLACACDSLLKLIFFVFASVLIVGRYKAHNFASFDCSTCVKIIRFFFKALSSFSLGFNQYKSVYITDKKVFLRLTAYYKYLLQYKNFQNSLSFFDKIKHSSSNNNKSKESLVHAKMVSLILLRRHESRHSKYR